MIGSALPAIGAPQRVDEDGHVVQFQRDIQPIFQRVCMECHNEEKSLGDFRIDDVDTVMDYIEPDDAESSSLLADFILSADEDMLMPPANHPQQLTPGEIALITLWIDEGASWPDPPATETGADAAASVQAEAPMPSIPVRLWQFQGYLHPATVHFPVALLLVGAFFVVVEWRYPKMGPQMPMACLILGALSCIPAAMMGWSLASQKGFTQVFGGDETAFYHRWSGIAVTVLSFTFAIAALVQWRRDGIGPDASEKSKSLGRFWRIGLVASAMLVGAVGHLGGDMTYGEGFYEAAFEKLFGKPAAIVAPLDETTNPS